jgi:hypothetical protein
MSRRESSPKLYFILFGLRRLNLEKRCESVANLFSDSLKLKISSSDLVSITLVKMVLKRRLFSISLTLFRTD